MRPRRAQKKAAKRPKARKGGDETHVDEADGDLKQALLEIEQQEKEAAQQGAAGGRVGGKGLGKEAAAGKKGGGKKAGGEGSSKGAGAGTSKGAEAGGSKGAGASGSKGASKGPGEAACGGDEAAGCCYGPNGVCSCASLDFPFAQVRTAARWLWMCVHTCCVFAHSVRMFCPGTWYACALE